MADEQLTREKAQLREAIERLTHEQLKVQLRSRRVFVLRGLSSDALCVCLFCRRTCGKR